MIFPYIRNECGDGPCVGGRSLLLGGERGSGWRIVVPSSIGIWYWRAIVDIGRFHQRNIDETPTCRQSVYLRLHSLLYPEWPHRQGGCLACCGCTFDSRWGCTDLYYARGAHGVLPMRVGGATSQLDLPSLTPLSVAGCGWLQLGVPQWAASVHYCKELIIDPVVARLATLCTYF